MVIGVRQLQRKKLARQPMNILCMGVRHLPLEDLCVVVRQLQLEDMNRS